MATETYFTVKELASRWKVTERTITQMARDGVIPAVRIGRLWRFKISAIEEWERNQGIEEQQITELVREITT